MAERWLQTHSTAEATQLHIQELALPLPQLLPNSDWAVTRLGDMLHHEEINTSESSGQVAQFQNFLECDLCKNMINDALSQHSSAQTTTGSTSQQWPQAAVRMLWDTVSVWLVKPLLSTVDSWGAPDMDYVSH